MASPDLVTDRVVACLHTQIELEWQRCQPDGIVLFAVDRPVRNHPEADAVVDRLDNVEQDETPAGLHCAWPSCPHGAIPPGRPGQVWILDVQPLERDGQWFVRFEVGIDFLA